MFVNVRSWKKGKVTKLNSTGRGWSKKETTKLISEESLSETGNTVSFCFSKNLKSTRSYPRFFLLNFRFECWEVPALEKLHRFLYLQFERIYARTLYLTVTDPQLFASTSSFCFSTQILALLDARATAKMKALFHFLFRWPRYSAQRVNYVTAMRARARKERKREGYTKSENEAKEKER